MTTRTDERTALARSHYIERSLDELKADFNVFAANDWALEVEAGLHDAGLNAEDYAYAERLLGTRVRCVECRRSFDLLDAQDAAEWYAGHDCEAN